MKRILKLCFPLLISLCLLLATSCTKYDNSSSGLISDNSQLGNTSDYSNDALKAHYLDVGQGDSIFLELPNKETMLIDSGTFENADKIIKYIKDLKYSKIDYVVGTHPHADHVGALADVLKAFDIGKIYMPDATTTGFTYENLLKTIKEKGMKITRAKAGVNIFSGNDFTAEMIAPVNDSYDDLNNYSAVIKITYKAKTFLFMGDAETKSEGEITASVKADVIKIGHHGSSSSTSVSFLKKVSPKYAVISVGAGNSYGHPTKQTLDRLNSVGCQVFRTDLLGTIVISSDGESIHVKHK